MKIKLIVYPKYRKSIKYTKTKIIDIDKKTLSDLNNIIKQLYKSDCEYMKEDEFDFNDDSHTGCFRNIGESRFLNDNKSILEVISNDKLVYEYDMGSTTTFSIEFEIQSTQIPTQRKPVNWKEVFATINVNEFELWLKDSEDYDKETKELVDDVIRFYLSSYKVRKVLDDRRKQGYEKQRQTWISKRRKNDSITN